MKSGARWALLGLVAVACGARSQLDWTTFATAASRSAPFPDAGAPDLPRTERDAGRSAPTNRDAGERDAAALDARPRDASDDANERDSGPACNAACKDGTSSCRSGGISQCTLSAADCLDWGPPAPCDPGAACQVLTDQAICIPILAPRPIAPLSTATVTSQQPLFHWAQVSGNDGAQVEIYRDRACTDLVLTFPASGTSGEPASALTAGVYFWRLRGRVGSNTSDQTSAVWELMVGARSAPINTSWGTVLDLNGDGFADVAAGTPSVNQLMGAVEIHLGSKDGLAPAPTTLSPPSNEDGPFAEFGNSVASAGDVNGDGFADLIVGATGGDASLGAAYLYLGGPGGVSATPITLTGNVTHGYFGWSVSSAGDVNGDGYADVVIAPDASGVSFLYLGNASGLSPMPISLSTPLGTYVASAGDLNGDGFGDIVVGANYANRDAGAAYVFLGSASGPGAAIAIPGPAGAFGFFGYSVASAGDVNADGFADIIIGSPGSAPAAYVYLGTAAGLSANPIALPNQGGPTDRLSTPTSVEFGAAVSGAGDVNGDGFADVVVGCTANQAVYVFLGSGNGTSTTPTPFQNIAAQLFGGAMAGIGDVNRDGFADLAVAAGGVGAHEQPGYFAVYFGSANGLATPPAAFADSGATSAL